MKIIYKVLNKVILLGVLFPLACETGELSKDEQVTKTITRKVWTQSSVSSDCNLTKIKRLHFQPDGIYRMEFELKTFQGNGVNILERWGVVNNQPSFDSLSLLTKTGTYRISNGVIELKDEFTVKLLDLKNGTISYRDSLVVEQVNWQILQADNLTLKVAGEKGYTILFAVVNLPLSPCRIDKIQSVPNTKPFVNPPRKTSPRRIRHFP